MRVTHQSATISFCLDLTHPDAPSIPVAHLLVASAGDERFAVVAALTPRNPKASFDPITADVLSDAPTLIRDHVNSVLVTLPADAPLELILTKLHSRLRNSLHVADISGLGAFDIDASPSKLDTEELIMDELTVVAVKRMHDAVKQFIAPTPPSREQQDRATRSFDERVPSRLAWPLGASPGAPEARA